MSMTKRVPVYQLSWLGLAPRLRVNVARHPYGLHEGLTWANRAPITDTGCLVSARFLFD